MMTTFPTAFIMEQSKASNAIRKVASTREEAPVPQLGERISVEEVAELASAVLAGAQAASPEPAPPPQLPPEQEFLLRLYQLLEQFDAELLYTKSDDGVHVQIGERKPLAGFMYRAELRDRLVEAGLLPAADQQEGRGDG